MKVTTIYYSSHFAKVFKKLPRAIQKKAVQKEKIFRANAFEPSLKTHKLKGQLEPLWAFSINLSYRIMLEFQPDGSVLFIDVGTHSIYAP